MTYSFRNRIRITDASRKLEVAATKFRLSPQASNERIMIQSAVQDQKINEAVELVMSGSGYQTAEAALEAGRKWRQVLSSVFARMLVPVDLGDDDEMNVTPREVEVTGRGLERIGVVAGDIIYDEHRFGLFVHKTEPKRRFLQISMGTPIVRVSVNEKQTHDRTDQALQRYSGVWDDELKLAYQLVHASLANDNPEARFILLVTAVEALIPHRKKEDRLSELLEALKPVAGGMSEFDEGTRESAKSLLDSSQYFSIRQFRMKLADRLTGEYGGKTPRKYFDDIYDTRSALSHGNLRNLPHLSIDALNQQYAELRRFVLDILESWTANPSYDVADQTD